MKILTACVVSCVFFLVLMAGCTSQPVSKQATPGTTAVPATINPTPSSVQVQDPSLVGTWYLKMMAEQGGPALVDMMSPQITAVFTNQSNVIGFSGCNNYNGHYTLTGQGLSNGGGISIGPLASTTMYCANSTKTETTYLQILQAAETYTVNGNQELTISDNSGNTLVYQKAPYSSAFVPKGF